MSPAAGLVLSEVAVRYGTEVALAPVSLALERGAWLAVIGPNGAGKSSLLRACAGLVEHEGDVAVDGSPLAGRSRRETARLVALVPQRPTLPATTSVLDYVLLGRTAHLPLLGVETRRDREIAAAAAEQLDLAHLAQRCLGSLSGGEAQRATLARAIAQQPSLLLLDEPTSSLDLGHEQQVLELVDELRAAHGLTVVSAMHDLTLAGQYADEMLLLAAGQAVARGSTQEVLRAPLLERHYGATLEVLARPDGPAVVPARPRRRGRAAVAASGAAGQGVAAWR